MKKKKRVNRAVGSVKLYARRRWRVPKSIGSDELLTAARSLSGDLRAMKKIFTILLISLFICVNAQRIVNNDTTINESAGETKKIRFLAFAHDEDGKFIFKSPKNIAAIDDGSFMVIDDSKLIKFGKNGKFIKIIVRRGEGPGEATYLNQIFKRKNDLVVNTGFMSKLMIFDYNGELKVEFRVPKITSATGLSTAESTFRIVGYNSQNDLLVIPSMPLIKENDEENQERKYSLMRLVKNKQWEKLSLEISVKAFSFETPFGKIKLAANKIIIASNEKYIYFSNTERYEIKQYNIQRDKIESIWRRKYLPVKIPEKDIEKYEFGATFYGGKNGKTFHYKPPLPENFPDIQRIFTIDDHLWIITSTVDKIKGVLVDVFDQKGNYVDNFYLSIHHFVNANELYRNVIWVDGSSIILREIDEDSNYKIVKYSIENITDKKER
ncbi:MAG: 6-bladed beta-propeller [Candidatus Aminicenantes bacterium]